MLEKFLLAEGKIKRINKVNKGDKMKETKLTKTCKYCNITYVGNIEELREYLSNSQIVSMGFKLCAKSVEMKNIKLINI